MISWRVLDFCRLMGDTFHEQKIKGRYKCVLLPWLKNSVSDFAFKVFYRGFRPRWLLIWTRTISSMTDEKTSISPKNSHFGRFFRHPKFPLAIFSILSQKMDELSLEKIKSRWNERFFFQYLIRSHCGRVFIMRHHWAPHIVV